MWLGGALRGEDGMAKPKTTVVPVRLDAAALAALDRYIREEEPKLSRPEALRNAFRDWAVGLGLLRFNEDPEGAN